MESSSLLGNADKFLAAQSTTRLATLLILLISGVGAVDHLTGYEISFSIFYLLPVCIASWYTKRQLGFVICAVSAVTWLGLDYTSGHQYSHGAILFWNAGVRLGFFVVVMILLKRLKNTLDLQASLAQIDSLTGLLNARTFKQRCSSYFLLASRHNRTLALGYLDLDGFKGINDKFGHSVGDEVLRAVGIALTKQLRGYDIGARLGGDEFAVLLPDTDYSGAQTFFQRLHNRLFDLARVNHWPLGVSIGVAIFHEPSASPDEALQIADALMYKVKKSGKNSIQLEEFGAASGDASIPLPATGLEKCPSFLPVPPPCNLDNSETHRL